MDTTTYKKLCSETQVNEYDDGIEIFLQDSWIVDGEHRISYTTIIRLIECCREYHWLKDTKGCEESIDSICAHIDIKFRRPLSGNARAVIKYKVIRVFDRKYIVDFRVFNTCGQLCCYAQMTQHFYDEKTSASKSVTNEFKVQIMGKEVIV